MGVLGEPIWNRTLGTTESGEPFGNLLWDVEVDRLRVELTDYPLYLLGLQHEGAERGTILQIAIKREQSKVVKVIVEALVATFEKAMMFDGAFSISENGNRYVHQVGNRLVARLVNENPPEVNQHSVIELLKALEMPGRQDVGSALVPLLSHFVDSEDRLRLALCVDSPGLIHDSDGRELELLLLALEYQAQRCFDHFAGKFKNGFEDLYLLHEAASRNWPETIRALIRIGVLMDGRDGSGQTPLHRAAFHEACEAVTILLELGANPRIEDNYGASPLFVAISEMSENSALILAQNMLSQGFLNYQRVFSHALRSGQFVVASLILGLNQSKNQVEANAISLEVSKWLFGLLAQVLDNASTEDEEIMPLLTLDDFTDVSEMIGLECKNPNEAVDAFLSSLKADPRLYSQITANLEFFGAPLCLLLCAMSLAIATTKENTTFHELHPPMQDELGSHYENQHLGEAWRNLRTWLSARDLTLAWPEEKWLKNVGPPLYHAIWRADDRERLFDALGSLGVNTSKPISPEQMGIYLGFKKNQFSTRVQKMLVSSRDRDAVFRSACANLSILRVQRTFRSRSTGNRTPWATLSWHSDLRTQTVSLYATVPCREGMPDSISFEEGQNFFSNGWTYEAICLQPHWLIDSTLGTLEGYSFRIPELNEPLIFERSGDKTQRHSLAIGEAQLIVCPEAQAADILDFLGRVQDGEVKKGLIKNFPDLVALGPITPVRDAEGPLLITPRRAVSGELVGGLKLRGATYHHLALPSVLIHGEAADAAWTWLVDGKEVAVEAMPDKDGQLLIAPSADGSTYCLQLNGTEVKGSRFTGGQSIAEPRYEEGRHRWPVLVPDKGEFDILGSSGADVANLRFSRKSGIPTVPFDPCWAVDTKAHPLKAVIPPPDHTSYDTLLCEKLRSVHLKSAAGDGMSQKKAQRFWEDYSKKVSQ